MQSPTTVLLYAACSVMLLAGAAFIFARAPRALINRTFALTALSLLAWVATLFFFDRTGATGHLLLWLGRTNFGAAALAASAAFCFVLALADAPLSSRASWMVIGETALVVALATFTPERADGETEND